MSCHQLKRDHVSSSTTGDRLENQLSGERDDGESDLLQHRGDLTEELLVRDPDLFAHVADRLILRDQHVRFTQLVHDLLCRMTVPWHDLFFP